jgi:hypothetical protein
MTFANSQQKPRISALEKSRRRANQNEQTGKDLGKVAKTHKDTAAEVTADLLKLSAYPKASGELTNLKDKKGRPFNCPHSFISANSILDTNYQTRTARRHRKTIYEAFERHLPDIVEHNLDVSFLTPTFPNLLGIGFADNDRFQAKAWELFLQTKVFADFFYAGYSKTEWTLGNKAEREKLNRAFDLMLDGINYHCHALCINYQPFASGETSQIENKLLWMHRNGKTAKETRPLRNSLKIVSAWTKCLKKAHREIFGKFLRIKTDSHRARFTFDNVPIDQIKAFDLDASKNGIFWEIAKTASYTAKGASFKELPPELLLEAENVFKGKRLINPFGAFRKYVNKDSDALDSLVNPPTKQTEKPLRNSYNSLFDNVLRGENEPLKTYGIRLCSQGLRDTWERYLDVNKDLIIAKRREALLERFPNSVFTDLSGQSYYGWQAVKEIKQREKEKRPGYNPETDNYWKFKRYQDLYFEQIAPLEADAVNRTPPKEKPNSDAGLNHAPSDNRNVSSYPLISASNEQAKRKSNWDLFNSFCDLGSNTEKGNSC